MKIFKLMKDYLLQSQKTDKPKTKKEPKKPDFKLLTFEKPEEKDDSEAK